MRFLGGDRAACVFALAVLILGLACVSPSSRWDAAVSNPIAWSSRQAGGRPTDIGSSRNSHGGSSSTSGPRRPVRSGSTGSSSRPATTSSGYRPAVSRRTSCSADPPRPSIAWRGRISYPPCRSTARRPGRWHAARGSDWPVHRQAGARNSVRRPESRAIMAFDDPRNDPISLAWAEAQLAGGPFAEGYARLVRAAGACRRIGRQAGSARAAVERGEAGLAPRAVTEEPADGTSPGDPWIEGVAILREAPHPEQAAAFLEFLAKSGQTALPPPRPDERSPAMRRPFSPTSWARPWSTPRMRHGRPGRRSSGTAIHRPSSVR